MDVQRASKLFKIVSCRVLRRKRWLMIGIPKSDEGEGVDKVSRVGNTESVRSTESSENCCRLCDGCSVYKFWREKHKQSVVFFQHNVNKMDVGI